jgi:hypothetical protein
VAVMLDECVDHAAEGEQALVDAARLPRAVLLRPGSAHALRSVSFNGMVRLGWEREEMRRT